MSAAEHDWSYGVGRSWPTLTDAQRQRVEENTGLIGWVLSRRKVRYEDWDDAFQDGVFGLMRAAQLFDPGKGFKFSTYATNWIKQSVARGEADAKGANFRHSTYVGEDFMPTMSLEAPVGEVGGNLGLLVLVSIHPGPERQAIAIALVSAARAEVDGWKLDWLDRAIVNDLFVPSDESWRQRDERIGRTFGCSHEWVRQHRKRLHLRLRTWAGEAAFTDEGDAT